MYGAGPHATAWAPSGFMKKQDADRAAADLSHFKKATFPLCRAPFHGNS